MTPQYKPIAVANTFVSQYKSSNLTHMKLQKLTYCVHGWWLAAEKSASMISEQPQVWKYGPVFQSMYDALRVFGNDQILEPVPLSPFECPLVVEDTNERVNSVITFVWKRYGHLSAIDLSEMTHKVGTAWRRIAEEKNFRVPRGYRIPDDFVRAEFLAVSHRLANSQ